MIHVFTFLRTFNRNSKQLNPSFKPAVGVSGTRTVVYDLESARRGSASRGIGASSRRTRSAIGSRARE